jgi:hypothetical protein
MLIDHSESGGSQLKLHFLIQQLARQRFAKNVGFPRTANTAHHYLMLVLPHRVVESSKTAR